VNSDIILGMGKTENNTVILLSLEKILLSEEMNLLYGSSVDLEEPVAELV